MEKKQKYVCSLHIYTNFCRSTPYDISDLALCTIFRRKDPSFERLEVAKRSRLRRSTSRKLITNLHRFLTNISGQVDAASHVIHRGAVEFMKMSDFLYKYDLMEKFVPESVKTEFDSFFSPPLTGPFLKTDIKNGFIIYPETKEAEPALEAEQATESSNDTPKASESPLQDTPTKQNLEEVKEARKVTKGFIQDAFTRRILSLYSYAAVQKSALDSGLIPDLLLYPLKDKSAPVILAEFKRPLVSIELAERVDQFVAYSAELAAKYPDVARIGIIYTNGWEIRFGMLERKSPSELKFAVVDEFFSLYE